MKLFQKTKSKSGSKVVVGEKSKVKKNPKKSLLKMGYFSVLAVLLFSAIGGGGYNYLQARQLTAHANVWPMVPGVTNDFPVRACKQTVKSGLGTMWNLKVLITRTKHDAAVPGTAIVLVSDKAGPNGKWIAYPTSSTWWLRVSTEIDVLVSKVAYPNAVFTVLYQSPNFTQTPVTQFQYPISNISNNC